MANRINLGQVIGATGQAGQNGQDGAKGEKGDTPYIQNGIWWVGTTSTGVTAKGNEWFSGDDAPTSEGVNGDLYLQTNGNVYKKESGVWVLKTNIKGQQGIQGERGESALTFDIGNVSEGQVASVTNSGTGTDIVLDFVIPKGDKGDKGDDGDAGSTITVGGFVVNNVNFDSDPQTQINNKLNRDMGVGNAGKILQVDSNGQVVPVSSTAEDDVIDGYYYNGEFYVDSEHTELLTGTQGKIYIDVANNTQYRYNGAIYVPLSTDLGNYPTKAQAVGSIELTMNSSTYVLTLQAKNVNGENVGTAQTVDLPLESVVMDIDYDDNSKELVITLNNGNTTRVDISDIVEGLQQAITSTNKLSADLVDDTNSTNKFVTPSEKTTWNGKMNTSNPSGTGSFSMNRKENTTVGNFSHTEGYDNTASGGSSHAEGVETTSSAYGSHTEGINTMATSAYSHSQGQNTTANSRSQFVFGEYNILDVDGRVDGTHLDVRGTYMEIAGNGRGENLRSNARTLDWDGNEVLAGTLTSTGLKDGNNANYKAVLPDTTSWTEDKVIATTEYVEDIVGDIDTLLADLNSGGGV